MSAEVRIVVAIATREQAYQLAQFVKRVSFETVRAHTEAHLVKEQRDERTYQMLAGLEAVGDALAAAGFAPR